MAKCYRSVAKCYSSVAKCYGKSRNALKILKKKDTNMNKVNKERRKKETVDITDIRL